jgi:hypothetical protein
MTLWLRIYLLWFHQIWIHWDLASSDRMWIHRYIVSCCQLIHRWVFPRCHCYFSLSSKPQGCFVRWDTGTRLSASLRLCCSFFKSFCASLPSLTGDTHILSIVFYITLKSLILWWEASRNRTVIQYTKRAPHLKWKRLSCLSLVVNAFWHERTCFSTLKEWLHCPGNWLIHRATNRAKMRELARNRAGGLEDD